MLIIDDFWGCASSGGVHHMVIYVIHLVRPLIPKVNIVKNLTPGIWYAQLDHLSYGAIQKLASVTLGMDLQGLILLEIYGSCMVG